MMRDDPELSEREESWICDRLTQAGVLVRTWALSESDQALASRGTRISPLRCLHLPERQSETSRQILATSLQSLATTGAAFEVVDALGRHQLAEEHIRMLIDFGAGLIGMSHDEHIQFYEAKTLRGEGLFRSGKDVDRARRLVDEGYYRCARPPSGPRQLRVEEPLYPREEDRARFREDSLKNLVFNVLRWHARASVFDELARVASDKAQGHTRFVLCEALRIADAARAKDMLMSLVGDPDIGASAIVELGKLAHEPARPFIEEFLSHPIDSVRRDAKKALRRLDQAAGRRAVRRAPFEEVLPQSERELGAKLVAGDGEEPREFKGEVSAFVIGCLAEDERGWTRDHCFSTSIELDELESTMRKLGRAFKGDFAGRRGKALREEIFEAEHESWKAYKLHVRFGDRDETIWFHYFMDDPTAVDLSIWGPKPIVERLQHLLPQE